MVIFILLNLFFLFFYPLWVFYIFFLIRRSKVIINNALKKIKIDYHFLIDRKMFVNFSIVIFLINLLPIIYWIIIYFKISDDFSQSNQITFWSTSIIILMIQSIIIFFIWLKTYYKTYLNNKKHNAKIITFEKKYDFNLLCNYETELNYSKKSFNKIKNKIIKKSIIKLKKTKSKIEVEKILVDLIIESYNLFFKAKTENIKILNKTQKIEEAEFIENLENYVYYLNQKHVFANKS